jgi:hypothetical protein
MSELWPLITEPSSVGGSFVEIVQVTGTMNADTHKLPDEGVSSTVPSTSTRCWSYGAGKRMN